MWTAPCNMPDPNRNRVQSTAVPAHLSQDGEARLVCGQRQHDEVGIQAVDAVAGERVVPGQAL